MKTPAKFLIGITVAITAAAMVYQKNRGDPVAPVPSGSEASPPPVAATSQAAKLPRLLDLGADKCIPCKMMAPILEELGKEYAGNMKVEFIDVWKNETAGKEYGIQSIPTQLFFDADGKELFRHTGFISKEDILAKWKELGVDLQKPST